MRVLDQRYELLEHLGSGAMASVWRARDRRLNRHVAVKVLNEQLATDTAFRERFAREAVNVAALKHPNIVTVYDAGTEGETSYIVMELVEGTSLQAKLEATTPYMGLERAQDLAAQLLAGLGHAHSKGIVHRDIKPANILIAPDGTAKLVDFGIARVAGDLRSLTTMGEFMGTPAYASPEQLDARLATGATDLYSLGCVLYECLAGHPPFEAEVPVGVIAQHLQTTPRSLRAERPEVPQTLDAIVLKALEKDPERRFGSAEEMLAALQAVGAAGPVVNPSLSTIVLPRRPEEGAEEGSQATPDADAHDRARVVVVDDHEFFRDGVTRGLTDSGRVDVVGEAENGVEALELIRRERPTVALVDYQMPEMDGLDLVHAVVDEHIPTRVVLLSAVADSAVVFRAIEEGAAGYLSKDSRRREIVDAVIRATEGQTVLPPELAAGLAGEIRNRAKGQTDQASAPTDAELEVLRGFAQGRSIPQVAAQLNLGVSTVRNHAQHLYEKLGVSDRTAAVVEAMRRGYLQ
ncbi:MAG TPA: protein kinase [Acidimicrobiales bacterium]|nr:protein kinase [Acidimicrobiales bacterium]